MKEDLKFSIIIPTYNEEKDIANTLKLITSIQYENKEIIVVDDSTDNTPQIVAGFKDKGVSIIHPEIRKGRCEARNIGIKSASGDVVIILNADVLLPNNFLQKIKCHYDNGYDSVTVMAKVANMKNMYARYVGLHHYKKEALGVYDKRKTDLKGIYWAEGFSVRKSLALQTSLFPSGYAVPIVAGEDVNFADELRDLGCKGIIDTEIVISHIAPDNLAEYWNIRKGRGAGTPQIRRFINKWSYKKIVTILILKAAKRFIEFVTVVPMVKYNYALARYSDRNILSETTKMCWCWLVEQIAFSIGEFQSFSNIYQKEK